MRSITLPLPMMGFVVATRAALAAGLALTFGDKLPAARRRAVGTTLIAIGAVTTVPILWRVFHGSSALVKSGVESDPRLVGATRFPRKGDDLL